MAPKSSIRSSASEGEGKEQSGVRRVKLRREFLLLLLLSWMVLPVVVVALRAPQMIRVKVVPSPVSLRRVWQSCADILVMVEVSVLWCCFFYFYCFAGVNRCKMCRGWCCSLVNDVINILVEYGEIDPDAEVNISVICVLF